MKQVFKANESLRRLVCALLVAIMVIGMIPLTAPKAAALSEGDRIYLKPNANWKTANARFAARFYRDNGEEKWMSMFADGEYYYCEVPAGNYPKVIFCRMNPANTTNNWENKWNQTADLTIPTNGDNCYTVGEGAWDNGAGNWSKINSPTNPPASSETAYLRGTMNNWADTANPMTGTNGILSTTITLNAGTYEFKVFYNNVWYTNTGSFTDTTGSGGWDMYQNEKNCTLIATGGSYTFSFNTSTKKLVVTHNSSGGGSTTTPTNPDIGDPTETTAPGSSVGTVVDIEKATFTEDKNKLYIGTTFYDYYTDWELNGENLDSHNHWGFYFPDHSYPFGQFNQALSSYYNTNKAKVPIYVGHFQPDCFGGDGLFSSKGISLYGYKDSENGKAYGTTDTHEKWFMSVNNSTLDISNTQGHYSDASWGIVAHKLSNNGTPENKYDDLLLDASGSIQPLFNEAFLLGKNSLNRRIADVYKNVQFPFSKKDMNNNGIMYWTFDSLETTLEMKKTSANQYFLSVENKADQYKNKDSGANTLNTYGFFPFNGNSTGNICTYNYGFGTRLDIPFNLTYDGKLVDKNGEKQDIIFKFSGDDDVWVFIDGKLALDIGGSHGRVTGTLNFADMKASVSSVKKSGGNKDVSGTNLVTDFTIEGNMTDEHMLTMFYMERGMWESNMSISFNFIPKEALMAPTTTVTATKEWNGVKELPQRVSLQLQHRVADGQWENVGDPVDVNASKNWTHTFENVNKFADEGRTKAYEFRVVEVEDGKVLEAGDSNSLGMIVTYGEVWGNGATGFNQTITNNLLANSVIVIDYGLGVDITVDNKINDSVTGTLYGIGDPAKLPIGRSLTFASSNLAPNGEYESDHGTATISNGKVHYEPKDMNMDSADLIGYCLKYTSNNTNHYYYTIVTVIPAANIYYEDNFLTFKDATGANDTYGKWVLVKDDDDNVDSDIQEEDRPGEDIKDALGELDADNVYGFDTAYTNCHQYSFGSAYKVTVDATTGNINNAPEAKFTFTGTGFDVVSVTDNQSGALWVEVTKDGKRVKSYIVNNYYGYNTVLHNVTYTYNGEEWVREVGAEAGADAEFTAPNFPENPVKDTKVSAVEYVWVVNKNAADALYQVPVIKVSDLQYGTYDVAIRAAYMPVMDTQGVGHYSIYVDAIRVYNPANDPTSKDAYDKDGESNPHLTTLKKLLVAAATFNDDGNANGMIYVDGVSNHTYVRDYDNQGPNNETYLMNSNAIAFKLRYTGSTAPTAQNLGIQIGAKLAKGSGATMNISCATEDPKVFNEKSVPLATATNMFYKLPTVSWTYDKVNGFYESEPIVISCTATGDNILSLTDLKLTGELADEVKASSTGTATAEILMVSDFSVRDAAFAVLSSGSDVTDPTDPTEPEATEPEATEPEATEPEATEPEATEPEATEPEATEPEATEPEATEPETTVPETTAPQKDPDNAQTGDNFGMIMPVFAAAAFVSLLAILCMAAYATRRAARD